MTMDKTNDRIPALENLFTLSRDAVLGVSRNKVVFCNDAARRLFGRELRGEALGALLPELVSAPEADSFTAAVSVREQSCTVTAVRQDTVLILTLYPQKNDAGAAGAALLSRLRMAAFRLRISLDALAEEAGQGETARRALHSYYALLHRIDQLSDAGSLNRGEFLCRFRPVDLCSLVRDLTDSVSVFAAGRRAALICDLPEEECFAEGDRERLEQMLLILLSNALLHTAPGGKVTVSLRRDGERHILSVDDSGEGMTAEELAYAFSLREDPPLTAAASGAGMGLYIVQGIARLHGGAAMLHSVPDQGTRVRVTIPVWKGCCVRDAAPASGNPDLILTELSEVLTDEAYDRKYRE